MTLYGIDSIFFEALDAATKEEVLKTEQKKYDERIAQETAAKEPGSYNFEANGFPADALTLYAIEKEFFECLPDDLKKDALEQARTEYNKKEEEKKKTQEENEKNDALSKKLKVLAILENAFLAKLAKDKGITVKDNLSEEQWSQLCTSINDLNEETKNVVLKSLPYELIKDFPEELRKAAKKLRRRYVEFYKKRTEPKENADSCSSSLLSISEQDLNPTAGDIFESTAEETNELSEEDQKILFETYQKKEDLEKIFNELSFYDELQEIDEETWIFVLNCFSSTDPNYEEHRQIRKLLKSLFLIPKNAYKILDFIIFILSFQEEYSNACSEKQQEVIDSQLSKKVLMVEIFDLSGKSRTVSASELKTSIVKLLHFLCEKKLFLPLLVNAYTFGCTGLIFDNATYQPFNMVKELREIISKRKIEAKKETVFEKLVQNNSDSTNFVDLLKDVVIYKEEMQIPFVKYPKVVANVPKNIIVNLYSSKLDFPNLANNFEQIGTLMGKNIDGLIQLALKNIHQEIEKWSKNYSTKKEKIIEYRNKNALTKDIASLDNEKMRNDHWSAICSMTDENCNELRDLRRYTRRILKKLRLAINKFAKNESKKKLDPELEKNSPEDYKEARKEAFYQIVHEILGQTNEKIHQDDTILLFFKQYFECWFVILNVVGVDFSFDNNYTARGIYVNNRSVFKLFIDFYSFLNPLGEEYQRKKEIMQKESESPSRPSTSKLSKLRTSAPEEEKKEVKFKSEKIGKIFGAFARKADVDNSLKNSLGMTYGGFASFVEFLIQFGLYVTNRISSVYHYYIKKAPTEHSVTSNIKFYYLRFIFLHFRL